MCKRGNLINMSENRIFPILSKIRRFLFKIRDPCIRNQQFSKARRPTHILTWCAFQMEQLYEETDNTSDIYQMSLLSYLQQYRTMPDTHKWTCLNLVNHKYPTPHNTRYSMNNQHSHQTQCHTCTEHVMGTKAGSQRDIVVP